MLHAQQLAEQLQHRVIRAPFHGRRSQPYLQRIAVQSGDLAALCAGLHMQAQGHPVVVGHQPTRGAVAAFLLSGEEAYWSVKKGAVWWLSNRDRAAGASVVLRVAIGPEFV